MTHTEIEIMRAEGRARRDWLDWAMLPLELVGRLVWRFRR